MENEIIESVWSKSEGSTDLFEWQFYGACQMKWFLERIFGENELGMIEICVGQERKIHMYDDTLITSIAMDCAELGKVLDVFFRVSMTCHKNPFVNSHYEESKSVSVMWINIRLQHPNTVTEALPSLVEALDFLKSQAIKPDIIVNIGHALQAYWLLKEPLIVDSAEAYDEVTELLRDFQQKIIADGLQRGWLIEDTANVNRYQRLPGTWNWDYNSPTRIHLLEPHNNGWIFIGKH
jgi:hypothetical protein